MAYELTFEQIQKCKKVFDCNKINPQNDREDSRIPSENLIKALQELEFNITPKELNSIIDELGMDAGNNDDIDFPTFLRIAWAKYKQQEFNLSLEDAFKSFDEENKEVLTYDQLKIILTQYGPRLDEVEAEELIKDFIEDNKQTFNYKEFISKNF